MVKTHTYAEMLQSVLDTSDAGVLCVEPVIIDGEITDFRILVANKANRDINGYDPKYLQNKLLTRVFPGIRQTDLFNAYVRVASTGEPYSVDTFYDRDGFRDWFRIQVARATEMTVTITFRNVSEKIISQRVRRFLIDATAYSIEEHDRFERDVLKFLTRELGFSHGMIAETAQSELLVRRLEGDLHTVVEHQHYPLNDMIESTVVRQKVPVSINDLRTDFDETSTVRSTPFKSFVGVPIWMNGEIAGTLSLYGIGQRQEEISSWKIETVQVTANAIGNALSNLNLFRKLSATSSELRMVLDNVPSRIWFKDDKNVVLRANRAAAQAAGIDEPSKVEGVPTETLFPEMAAKYYRDDMIVFERGEAIRGIIESHSPKSGVQGWISTDKIPLRDESGKRYLLAVATDITRLKLNQEELERANENLSQFTQIAAHDLRAPARQALTFIDLFREDLEENQVQLSDDAIDYLSDAQNSLSNMKNLVDTLYNLHSIDSEQIRLKMQDLGSVVQTAADYLENDLANSAAKLEIEELPHLNIDAVLMTQLFQNLISNACKYARNDALIIRVRSRKDAEARRWIVMIEDNGPGITEEDAQHIFQPFQRLHHSTDIEGLGIGLAFCKKIAALHKADLYLDSSYTSGARFVLSFNI